jgi:outer membrane receptor for ferrienterochelin and colicin
MIIKNHLTKTGVLIVVGSLIGANHIVFADDANTTNPKAAQEYGGDVAAVEKANTTIIYGPEFFARFPNAVSAADLVGRIPGGGKYVSRRPGGGDNNNSRGFSNNQDGILINGRRLSGKGNDSASALARISKDQVERIELIRGSNPDIKSAGQSSVINVITKADIGSGSGSWSVQFLTTDNGMTRVGGDVSYGGKVGALEYFLSAESKPEQRHQTQYDEFFDETDTLTKAIDFDMANKKQALKVSTNLTYTLPSGDPIRLNAMFQGGPLKITRDGELFIPDANNALLFDAYTKRFERTNKPEWEIGGDYETNFSENLEFKLIGLYASRKFYNDQSEDFDFEEDDFQEDVLSDFQRFSSEAIGRVSLGWTGLKGHDIEIGSEVAINTMKTDLAYSTRVDGILTPVDVSNSALDVKETRIESFINDTWTINDKLTLESAVVAEISEITVAGGVSEGRNLFYVKPTVDLRYNVDQENQLQFTILREVGQLDFSNFASSVSLDDEVIGGNDELVPYKNWEFKVGYEHRLADDGGSIKLTGFNAHITDVLERAEVAPGVSGTANVGKAMSFGVDLEANLRLDKIGMKNAVLRITGRLARARFTDAFTGVKRSPNWYNPKSLFFVLNQDIPKWGISYTLNYSVSFPKGYVDINEIIEPLKVRHAMWGNIEKRLTDNLILHIGGGPFMNMNQGRDRYLYDGGIAGGIVTGRQLRDKRFGRRYRIMLKGTF